VTYEANKKVARGRVVAQGLVTGRRLPGSTRVPIVVSKGHR
jgi:beta-lactam-binding protein with PASTA domain